MLTVTELIDHMHKTSRMMFGDCWVATYVDSTIHSQKGFRREAHQPHQPHQRDDLTMQPRQDTFAFSTHPGLNPFQTAAVVPRSIYKKACFRKTRTIADYTKYPINPLPLYPMIHPSVSTLVALMFFLVATAG